MPTRSATDLGTLRQAAEALAAQRRETPTTAHLLAALIQQQGVAATLLKERQLTSESLLRAARVSSDSGRDPLGEALRRAREVAGRMRAPDTTPLHLLVALLSETRSGAYRTLDQCGLDVSRLRVHALNAALRQLGRQSIMTRREESAQRLRANSPKRAVTVPVMPRLEASQRAIHRQLPDPQVTRELIDAGPELAGGGEVKPPAESSRGARGAASDTKSRKRRTAKSRFKLDGRRCPTLNSLGVNLCLAAERAELEPVAQRNQEIGQALDVLAKHRGNSPCFVGLPGVGKTTLVHGLAQHIVESVSEGSLDDRVVLELSLPKLLAGTAVRGALAERLATLLKETQASDHEVVLFFDRLHEWFAPEVGDELTSELKDILGSGKLRCVATDTDEHFARLIEREPSLSRIFTPLPVDEPSREDAFLMLTAACPRLAEHHAVEYPEDTLALTVAWSVKYVPGRALPEKALGLLDLAGARARRREHRVVTPDLVAEVFSEQTDVPIERMLESDGERLLRLEEQCAERVIGHADKIQKMARIIRRNAAGLNGRRPIGTFLLLGPTGVGKTETAKALAEALFYSEDAMTRIDMSEYSEAHAVARLIGAPPGYIGHETGGQLTEAVRRRPYQVILLDEIEKAHPEVLQSFLAVLDEGRMTDGRGRLVDFTNTLIILTSNIGAKELGSSPQRRVGFGNSGAGDAQVDEERVVGAARKILSPEWYNRIDEVLVYAPLTRPEVRNIAVLLLERLGSTLRDSKDVGLQVTTSAVEHLLDHGGFVPELGARPVKRTIARTIEAVIAEKLLSGHVPPGATLVVSAEGKVLNVDVLDPEPSRGDDPREPHDSYDSFDLDPETAVA